MSKWYWIVPKDQRYNNWILHADNPKTGRRLRDRYSDRVCPRCHKLDEFEALKGGIDNDVAIRSRSDFFRTDDGFYVVSSKAKGIVESSQLSSVQFFSLPGTDEFHILMPTEFVATDTDNAGMEFHRSCNHCGRFRETCGLPSLDSLSITENGPSLICPDIAIENVLGRVYWYLIPEDIKRLFQETRLSGVEYLKAS